MKLDVKFTENNTSFDADFGEAIRVSDGGYDQGYAEGHAQGYTEGEAAGHAAGRIDGYNSGYESGHAVGKAEGIEQGVADGKQAEYDRFWDAYQYNGTRTSYYYAFAGRGWTDETFKPKYKIKPRADASAMFHYSQVTAPLTADMLDCSGANSFYNTFRNSQFKEVELIDFSLNGQVLSYTFAEAEIEKIGLLIMSDIATAKVNATTFQKMSKLSYIRIQGTLTNLVNFSWSPLSVDSMKSIILALKDCSGTDKEYAYTVSFSKGCWDALLSDGTTAPNGTAWDEYARDIKCWNI